MIHLPVSKYCPWVLHGLYMGITWEIEICFISLSQERFFNKIQKMFCKTAFEFVASDFLFPL